MLGAAVFPSHSDQVTSGQALCKLYTYARKRAFSCAVKRYCRVRGKRLTSTVYPQSLTFVVDMHHRMQ